jgi:hypothetical protein
MTVSDIMIGHLQQAVTNESFVNIDVPATIIFAPVKASSIWNAATSAYVKPPIKNTKKVFGFTGRDGRCTCSPSLPCHIVGPGNSLSASSTCNYIRNIYIFLSLNIMQKVLTCATGSPLISHSKSRHTVGTYSPPNT